MYANFLIDQIRGIICDYGIEFHRIIVAVFHIILYRRVSEVPDVGTATPLVHFMRITKFCNCSSWTGTLSRG